jgi:hypothetical protein
MGGKDGPSMILTDQFNLKGEIAEGSRSRSNF